MAEHSEGIDLGFSVAEAESPELHLAGQELTLRFADWRERKVTVVFKDTIALRWQEADRYVDEHDRYDATVVIHESGWLAEHQRQAVPWANATFRHLKLNFNAAGILEVLCTATEVQA